MSISRPILIRPIDFADLDRSYAEQGIATRGRFIGDVEVRDGSILMQGIAGDERFLESIADTYDAYFRLGVQAVDDSASPIMALRLLDSTDTEIGAITYNSNAVPEEMKISNDTGRLVLKSDGGDLLLYRGQDDVSGDDIISQRDAGASALTDARTVHRFEYISTSSTQVMLDIQKDHILIGDVGSASAPVLSFEGDTDTGMWHPAANQIEFIAGGKQRLNIGATDINFYDNADQIVLQYDDSENNGSWEFLDKNNARIFTLTRTSDNIRLVFGGAAGGDDYIEFNDTDNQWDFYTDGTNYFKIGTSTAQFLNLDSIQIPVKTSTGDPSGAEGRFYVNTTDNALRLYADGAWRTVVSW